MSDQFPSSLHSRLERRWTKHIKSLRQLHDQVVLVTERTLQRMFNGDGSLVPVPARAVVDRPRPIRHQPRD
jgi:hypothetical protein